MPGPEPDIVIKRRSLEILDDRTNTPIMIFYDPFLRRWRAYLLRFDGTFYCEVTSINACGCGVAEYCDRSSTSGNVYVDVCYCEGVDMSEINLKFQPPWEVVAAYFAGRRATYTRRIREILVKMADYLRRRIKQRWDDVEDALNDFFREAQGLDIIADVDYDGFFVTVTLFCPGIYHGAFCRMSKHGCARTDCRSLCDAGLAECDENKIKECIKTKKVVL